MSDQYIGEIRIVGFTFAPRGWANCDGQLLSIAQNTALFSLYGTTYGGDGRTTFGLPNFQGRAAMHQGRGPGLTPRTLGARVGAPTVTLTGAQMPSHTHQLQGADEDAAQTEPAGAAWAITDDDAYSEDESPQVAMASDATTAVGGGQAHNNMQPYLVLRFVCALTGLYPSRS